jgi:hypothetical protein
MENRHLIKECKDEIQKNTQLSKLDLIKQYEDEMRENIQLIYDKNNEASKYCNEEFKPDHFQFMYSIKSYYPEKFTSKFNVFDYTNYEKSQRENGKYDHMKPELREIITHVQEFIKRKEKIIAEKDKLIWLLKFDNDDYYYTKGHNNDQNTYHRISKKDYMLHLKNLIIEKLEEL